MEDEETIKKINEFHLSIYLQWFVTEQIEEATIEKYLNKIRFIKDDKNGILMLDAEMAQRVYTPPATETAAANIKALELQSSRAFVVH